MWVVAKYNSKGLEIFKKELSCKLNKEVEYYHPKIKIKDTSKVKKFKYILGQYIFVKVVNFLIETFQWYNKLKRLDYLNDCFNCQSDIVKFINL